MFTFFCKHVSVEFSKFLCIPNIKFSYAHTSKNKMIMAS